VKKAKAENLSHQISAIKRLFIVVKSNNNESRFSAKMRICFLL